VPNIGTIDDFGPDEFSTDDVHRIAILDLRILNLDRNEGNILVQKAEDKKGNRKLILVPIDHGMSLPDTLELCSFDLCWLGWPQAEEKFS